MKEFSFCFLIAVFLAACKSDSSDNSYTVDTKQFDSCSIAKKFDMPLMEFPNYHGDLINYWDADSNTIDYIYTYDNGKLIESRFYYPNGQIQEHYHFRCESMHGTQSWYYPNGQLAKSIPMSYGYRNGTGVIYDSTGVQISTVLFQNDSIISQ